MNYNNEAELNEYMNNICKLMIFKIETINTVFSFNYHKNVVTKYLYLA